MSEKPHTSHPQEPKEERRQAERRQEALDAARGSAAANDAAALRREIAELKRQVRARERELGQLRSSEEHLRLLIEGSKRFFFVASLDLNAIHYVSPEYETMWGRTIASLYQNPITWLQGIHPEDRPRVMAAIERRRREAQGLPDPGDAAASDYNDYRIVRPDGTMRWVRGRSFVVPGVPNLAFGIGEDVTELKEQEAALLRDRDALEAQTEERQAEIEQISSWLVRETAARQEVEESLRKSEELYRLLAEYSTDMITKHNREGVFIYVSPASHELVGYSPEELQGKNPYDFIHPDDIALMRELHNKVLTQPGINDATYRMRRRDGSYTWLETTTKMIHDPETKEFQNIICVTRDVAKRREAETRAALLQQQLAHAARVSTLGELSSGLAHELNQPLTAVGNYLETCRNLLIGARAVPEEALAALAEAGAEAQRAGRVIHSLRNMVRPSPTDQVLANLNDLVGEVMELCAALFRMREVTLELALKQDLPLVLIDPVQIQQAVLNLVRNALDSMATSDKKRVLTVETARLDGRVQLTVLDTGVGCPPDEIPGLFEPFHTTKPTGLGLGLFICRRIIEAHGGTVSGRTLPAGGMAFSFTLPAAVGGGYEGRA
jgi:two-component system, LuxR family, sensor kinase FixL